MLLNNAVRHTQTTPLWGTLSTSTGFVKWLIIHGGRWVTSQAVIEAGKNRYRKKSREQEHVRPSRPTYSSADLGSCPNFMTLIRRQCGAQVSYYPSLVKPFLLATCHLQREKVITPTLHSSVSEAKVLLPPDLQP